MLISSFLGNFLPGPAVTSRMMWRRRSRCSIMTTMAASAGVRKVPLGVTLSPIHLRTVKPAACCFCHAADTRIGSVSSGCRISWPYWKTRCSFRCFRQNNNRAAAATLEWVRSKLPENMKTFHTAELKQKSPIQFPDFLCFEQVV